MLRVEEGCKHPYMSFNPLIQPGLECLFITAILILGMVHICFYLYLKHQQSKSALYNEGSNAPIWLSGRVRSYLTLLLNLASWVKHCAKGEWFSPVQACFSDYFSNKTVKDGIFGLDMLSNEILSRLFNQLNLKILDISVYGRH